MSAPLQHGLIERRGLLAPEIREIRLLAHLCNQHEGLDIKVVWSLLRDRPADQLNDFLYYADGHLVGFLALFIFNAHEAEVSGMVHPAYRRRGIFRALLEAARQECRRRGLSTLLLIVEHASSTGQTLARHLSTSYDHSEYKMVLQEPRWPAPKAERLHLRAARPEDAPTLARITAQAFNLPENEVDWYTEQAFSDPDHRRYYVGETEDGVIGKIDIDLSEEGAFLFGFAVLPEQQGQGYGRQMLARTVQQIQSGGQQNICLEVDTDNIQALTLYHSCGFQETGSYDYYRFPTSD